MGRDRAFMPVTGFDPSDGLDPAVTFSADNPLAPTADGSGLSVVGGGLAKGHADRPTVDQPGCASGMGAPISGAAS